MLHETGALISLQPNASKIVTQLGLGRFLVSAKPMVDRGFRLFDIFGNLVNELKLETSQFGADRVLYHRQDLHSALRQAASSAELPGKPVEIRTASPVVKCNTDEGIVTIENGEEFQADLVIGADGIKSIMRSTVLNDDRGPIPTGISAYRILMPSEELRDLEGVPDIVRSSDPAVTSMVVGNDKRVIMGPGRGGELFGIVALVPDEMMHEESSSDSWVKPGSKQEVQEAFKDFAPWLSAIFDRAPADQIGLWQLRDLDPLPTWVRGRAVLIGDAAHAMLPTQGQGASQSIEDAEALRAFFEHINHRPSRNEVQDALQRVFEARFKRVSLIQAYSRQQAKPGADKGSATVTLNPGQFMEYNCKYIGAVDWLARQRNTTSLAT